MTSNNIYMILSSKPHSIHYLKRYVKFIQNCIILNLKISTRLIKHHICPKANDMFPEYKSFKINHWNCAKLTERQHIIAHWMLWKIYNNKSTARSFWMMRLRNESRITSRVYENLREEFRINMQGTRYKCEYCNKSVLIRHFNNCPLKAKEARIAAKEARIAAKEARIAAKEARIAAKEARIATIAAAKEARILAKESKLVKIKSTKIKTINGGFKQTDETKNLIRETRLKNRVGFGESNGMFGKHHSDEARKAQSDAKRGDKHPNFGKHLSEETLNKLRKPHKKHKAFEKKLCMRCQKMIVVHHYENHVNRNKCRKRKSS